MDEQTKEKLRLWAKEYNTEAFIKDDPVQFPHRFAEKRDIETSAFLTSWLSYGRREQILRKANELHKAMGEGPYRWIMEEGYKDLRGNAAESGGRDTFYRFYTYAHLCRLCERLRSVYKRYDSLEDALAGSRQANPIVKIQDMFSGIEGIPVMNGSSACKRLAMFLRWMVRNDGIVDFGIWRTAVKPCELIIPLDTHVHQISMELGLTAQKNATMKTAIEITEALKEVFPDDPCLGDFALFGYDINRKSE